MPLAMTSTQADTMENDNVQFSPEALHAAVRALGAERAQMAAEIAALRQRLDSVGLQVSSPSSPAPQSDTAAAADPSLEAILQRTLATHLIPPPFSGAGQESPIVFYRAIEQLVTARHIPFSSLLDLVSSLLSGPAAVWFRSVRPVLSTNEALLTAFKEEFMPPPMEIAVLASIRAARQGDNETTVHFIDRICALYATLPTDRPTSEIIQNIIVSARPQVALHLGTRHTSVGALRADAHRIDTLLPRQAPPKTVGQPQASNASDKRTCYKCGQAGHIRRNCTAQRKNGEMASPQGLDSPRQEC